MSSLIPIGNSYAIAFFPVGGGSRKWLRLGPVAKRTAQDYQRRVDEILEAQAANYPLRPDTAAWLAGVDETIHARMVKAGLARRRRPKQWEGGRPRLVTFLALAIRNKRRDLKPRSRALLMQTARRLRDHFKDNPTIDAITPADAAGWRRALQDEELKEPTIHLHIRNAKSLFAIAVKEEEILTASPFRQLKSASRTGGRHYVTLEQAAAVIEELPGAEWRALFGLARYAGLRAPSETHILTWADVNFQTRMITVHAPKTEETRVVPMAAELEPLLLAAQAEAVEGQALVFPRGTNNLHRTVEAAAARAGIAAWPKTFQSLRQSCENDWMQVHPYADVADWIGHDPATQAKYYAMTRPENTKRAAGAPLGKAHQKAHQKASPANTINANGGEPHRHQRPKNAAQIGESSPGADSCGNHGEDYESPALTAELQGRAHSVPPLRWGRDPP